MRKVILSMMVSLDGYVETNDHQLDWHVWDDEMGKFIRNFLGGIDTILLGRKTYELMVSYWPTVETEDPAITGKMNNLPKVVFSTTLSKVDWNNARLVKENIAAEINTLKQQPGKDMVLFGGATLAATFMQLGLFDEYQLILNPVVLGDGNPLFHKMERIQKVELVSTKAMDCGNVVLHYKVK